MDNSTVVGSSFNGSANAGVSGGMTGQNYQLATESNTTAAATAAISNALKFATSKSIRTSTIILACFNALAAFTTAMGIIYGSYTYRKRMQRRASDPSVLRYRRQSSSNLTEDRPSGLFFIPTIEVFPLVLSLAITIQSITFAAAQFVGLQALLSSGCTLVAIFMLPGELQCRLMRHPKLRLTSNNSRFYCSFHSSGFWSRDRDSRLSITIRATGKVECRDLQRDCERLHHRCARHSCCRSRTRLLLRLSLLVCQGVRAGLLRRLGQHWCHLVGLHRLHLYQAEQEPHGRPHGETGSIKDGLLSGFRLHLQRKFR